MLLIEGGNQTWYSFKSSITDHISCNPKRGGGNFHFKSKQFEAAQEKQYMSTLSATTKVVGCALQVCKIKAAATHFETLVGFLSFCGVDVGNIGHGR